MSEIDSMHSRSHATTPERFDASTLKFGDLSGVLANQPIASEVKDAVESIRGAASSAMQAVATLIPEQAPATPAPSITAGLAAGAPLWTPDAPDPSAQPLGLRVTVLAEGLREANQSIQNLQNAMEQLRSILHQPHERIDALEKQIAGLQSPGVQ